MYRRGLSLRSAPTRVRSEVGKQSGQFRLPKRPAASFTAASEGRPIIPGYFLVLGLSICMVAVSLISTFHFQQQVRSLVALVEHANVAIAQFTVTRLRTEQPYILSADPAIAPQSQVASPSSYRLREEVASQFASHSLVNVSIFDAQRVRLFSLLPSTDAPQIDDLSGFRAAASGQVRSQLGDRDTVQASNGISDSDASGSRYLVTSYVPIYDRDNADTVVGVAQLSADVTASYQLIRNVRRDIILGSAIALACFAIAIVVWLNMVNRALKHRERHLQTAESRYQRQTQKLEQALSELSYAKASIANSEQMAILGRLTADVAHGINDPINSAHGNLYHVQRYVKDLFELVKLYQQYYPIPVETIEAKIEEVELEFVFDDLPRALTSISTGMARTCQIASSLQTFSWPDENTLQQVDIHTLLDRALSILDLRLKAHSNRTDIQVIKHYGYLPVIKGYPGPLKQVFIYILSNAIDALQEEMALSTREDLSSFPARLTLTTSFSFENDGWIQIAIADNGLGMSEDVQEHIFEPFFTTKPAEKGTGLGLSISHQIIQEKHGGTIRCVSVPGRGTEFIIRLPVTPRIG